MSRVIDRAQADIEAGRLWKARDRLTGALAYPADADVLPLLGDVLYRMGDLPAAGAAWFATGRSGTDADRARAAWTERHGGDALQLWLSLPATVRDLPHPDVRLLQAQATEVTRQRLEAGRRVPLDAPLPAAASSDWIGAVAVFALLAVVALTVVGLWTVVTWIA